MIDLMAKPDTGPRTVRELPVEQRIEYLRVLAALASADGILGGRELGALEAYCNRLGLDYDQRAIVFDAARRVEPRRVAHACERFRGHDLRFALLTDLMVIAMTDRTYGDSEQAVVSAIADLLDIPPHRVKAMERYADRLVRSVPPPTAVRGAVDDPHVAQRNALISALGAVVTVLVMVAAAGRGTRVTSFSRGLDRIALGMGIPTGIVVATAIGAIAFFVVHGVLTAMSQRDDDPGPRIIK